MSCLAGPVPPTPNQGEAVNQFCVNRGVAVAVMAHQHGTEGNVQIGTIEHNDYFRYQHWLNRGVFGWPIELMVLVRDFSGALRWGHVPSSTLWPAGWTPIENAFFSSEQWWNGMTLRAFTIQNRDAILRNRTGGVIETLLPGTTIGVRAGVTASMGQTWCTSWQVTAVVRPVSLVSAQWQWADRANSDFGFVDTGLPFNRPNTSTIRTSLA